MLRVMSTTVAILFALVVAGALAVGVQQFDHHQMPKQTACGKRLDAVFANGADSLLESVLLERLLEHRDTCVGDAAFVDQTALQARWAEWSVPYRILEECLAR